MALEDKITETGIKKVLIVDDSPANIQAAKKYFSQYKGIQFDYATSGKEAIEKIKQEYNESKYDLVLSDLEMESKDSGIAVTKAAFTYQGIGAIVTGRNYDRSAQEAHGPNTALFIGDKKSDINGKKEVEEVWEKLFGDVVQYLSNGGQFLIRSNERYYKHVHKPSEEIGEVANKIYSELKY